MASRKDPDEVTTMQGHEKGVKAFTPSDLRRAALSVCTYANDAVEAHELLDMLGLTEPMKEQKACLPSIRTT